MKSMKGRSGLFRTLLLGIIGICLLAVLVLLVYLFLHSGPVYRARISDEMKRYVRGASEALVSMIDEDRAVVEALAQSPELIKQLREHGVTETPEVYRVLYQARLQTGGHAALHLLSPSRKQAVSLGYNSHEYQIGNYAGIDQLLQKGASSIVMPKRFLNTNGEQAALVVAARIMDGDTLLGYACMDISDAGVADCLKSSPEVKGLRLAAYVQHAVCTWYDYVIYSESLPQSLYAGSSTLSAEATDALKQPDGASASLMEDGGEWMLAGVEDDRYRFVTLGAVSMDFFLRENERNVFPILMVCLFIAAVGAFVAWKINQEILRPIRNILDTLQRFDAGDMSVRCRFETGNELAMIRDQLNQLIVDVDQTMRNNREKQELLMVAENNMLKAQIKPHFLNNVLESVYWMIRMNKIDEACTALTSMGKIITARMNFSAASHETLDESLQLTQQYITLQRLCYPGKFTVEMDVTPDAGMATLPVFLLQPLVENAIHHGLQPKVGRGMVRITARVIENVLRVSVEDNGVGMDEDALQNALKPPRLNHGIALYNIHRRMELFYGDAGKFEILSSPERGTIVTVAIPQAEEEGRGHVHPDDR